MLDTTNIVYPLNANPQSKIDRILFCLILVILVAQMFFFSVMSYAFGLGGWASIGGFAMIPYLIGLGIPGAVFSIILLKRKTFKGFAIICLVFSVLTAVPYSSVLLASAASFIIFPTASPVVEPWRDARRDAQEEVREQTYEEGLEALYKKYKEAIRDPKEVVAIKRNQLLLSDGRVLILAFTTGIDSPEFDAYVEENLILSKKSVLVMLPPYDEFRDQYSGDASLFYDYKKPDAKLYEKIPALVFVDGKLLNLIYMNTWSPRDIAYQGSLELLKEYERNGHLP